MEIQNTLNTYKWVFTAMTAEKEKHKFQKKLFTKIKGRYIMINV
jgi:hypothetical protein